MGSIMKGVVADMIERERPRFRPLRRERHKLGKVSIPPSLWSELDRAAKKRGMKRSEFIEHALRFALDYLVPNGDVGHGDE